MNATRFWPALLLAGACAAPAHAQCPTVWCAPALQQPISYAPDACGPGFYWANDYGMYYGPSYYLRPCFPPIGSIMPSQANQNYAPGCKSGPGSYPGLAQGLMPQGMVPGAPYAPYGGPGAPGALPNPGLPPGQQQPPTFVSHPWTRSPRDFFMWNEVVEDQAKRYPLPILAP